ncbi:MAG: class I SAM-dependent methyltransferase [Bryobacteraceae bacterium]
MTHSVRIVAQYIFAVALAWYVIRQCRKPTGWLGRFIVKTMNRSHSGLTSWGLEHVQLGRCDAVLDVGCGGGRTVQTLAEIADLGKVHGVGYAEASVEASRGFNRDAVESRVLKPGGSVLIIAEAYRGRRFDLLYQLGMKLTGGTYLSPDDHRNLFVKVGYADAQVFLQPAKGWICARGRKPPWFSATSRRGALRHFQFEEADVNDRK